MKEPKKIISVNPLDQFKLEIRFEDGIRIVDMKKFDLRGVFKKISENEEFFKTVYLDPEFGTVTWKGGLMLENNDLYEQSTLPGEIKVASLKKVLTKLMK